MRLWPETCVSKNPLSAISPYRGFLFPTVAMVLDVKKSHRPEGEEWLMLQVTFKSVKNGRFDVELVVYDVGMDLVALSNHVAIIIGGGKRGELPKLSKSYSYIFCTLLSFNLNSTSPIQTTSYAAK